MNSTTELDTFETALLTELRREVIERPLAAPVRPPRRRRRLRLAAVAATGVAASVVAVFGLSGSGGSPAYAIVQDGDGDVIVTVHRLDDAAGLEQALVDRGIDADVSYDPHGSPDGHTYTINVPPMDDPASAGQEGGAQSGSEDGPSVSQGGGEDSGPTTSGPGSVDDVCGPPGDMQTATLQQQGDDWVLRIPAGSPLLDGRHLDIGTTVDGTLTVFYAGEQPGSYCMMGTMGTPPA